MTVYKLSESITFNSSSLVLMNSTENEKKITITHSSSRCLVALLEAEGKVISRDELLQIGWGYAGLVVTSNSLSQAMTLLRKSLKQIGLDDMKIVTVSKMGYRISRHQNDEEQTHSVIESNDILFSTVFSNFKKKYKKVIFSSLLAVVVALLILAFFTDLLFYKSSTPVKYVKYQNNKDSYSIQIQQGISTHSDYFKSAMNLINNDETIRKTIEKTMVKKPYIYINKSLRKDSHAFFICDELIKNNKESCVSIFIVTVGQ